MGKDLKGKELGVGIVQEKNGYYMGRFVDKTGKRVAKRFKKLQECRKWIADATFVNSASNLAHMSDMTVDGWFNYWISIKEQKLKPSTARLYRRRYSRYITGQIGKYKLADIKPLHCQMLLNKMAESGYCYSTIKSTKMVLHSMLETACENDILISNPCKKSMEYNLGTLPAVKEALTIKEQQVLLDNGGYLSYFDQFLFILQTGLRIGELIGLEWNDIDFENRTMSIQRTMTYQSDLGTWETTVPKTEAGIRTVPLTNEAVDILKRQKIKNWNVQIIPMEWRNKVFLNKTGHPVSCTNYDNSLASFCKKHQMKTFSVHILRHTFATRCIEGGMKPKTLQKILGHASLRTTMDLYVHITEDEKRQEIDKVENVLKMVQ